MHGLLVNCLFMLAQEKVLLGELTVDLGRKATKQTNKNSNLILLLFLGILHVLSFECQKDFGNFEISSVVSKHFRWCIS